MVVDSVGSVVMIVIAVIVVRVAIGVVVVFVVIGAVVDIVLVVSVDLGVCGFVLSVLCVCCPSCYWL